LYATELAKPGEIFALKMKAVKIGDLAEASMRACARSKHNYKTSLLKN